MTKLLFHFPIYADLVSNGGHQHLFQSWTKYRLLESRTIGILAMCLYFQLEDPTG